MSGCGSADRPERAYARTTPINLVFPGFIANGPAPVPFKKYCASCHFLDKEMVGPPLQGVVSRSPYPGWLNDFVTDEDSLISVGEPYTEALNAKSTTSYSHQFALSAEELEVLKNYFD